MFFLSKYKFVFSVTSIFSEKISPANDGLFVIDGLFVHEGLYVYVQLTYKKAWIFLQLCSNWEITVGMDFLINQEQ